MSNSTNSIKQAFSARKKRQIAKYPELYPQYNGGGGRKHEDNTNEASAKALEGLIQKVKGKPFFNWSVTEPEGHRRLYEACKCDCFYCIFGWLKKNDSPLPLWDYEQVLQDTIENESKYILIRKSTGLGITSFWLYYWIYRALRGHLMNKEVAIIVGPSQQLAIDLIAKIRSYFLPHGIKFDSRATTLTINGCTFNSKPSNHLDSLRSRMDLKVIIVDELDYLVEAPERAILRDVIERYLAKTDPYIILISTPGKDPNTSLMKQIEDEENSIYHKFVLDWTTDYNKIYSDADIAIAKRSPSWEREYCAQYGGWSGNVHSLESIHRAVEIEGKKYDPKSAYTANARHIVSIDPGYTEQSKFGVCVLQLSNGKAQVLLAGSYANVDIVKGVDFTVSLMRRYLPFVGHEMTWDYEILLTV